MPPQVWIGCLAAYNGGNLHGRWVDATDMEELEAARAEGFGSLASTLGEWPDFKTLSTIGQAIQEHGQSVIGYIATCEPGLDEDLISGFKDAYCGEWDSENAYAEDLIREVGLAGVEQFPDSLMPYLDIDKVARELFLHGTLCTHPAPAGGVFVFDTAA